MAKKTTIICPECWYEFEVDLEEIEEEYEGEIKCPECDWVFYEEESL